MSKQDPFDHLNHIADGRILASKDELQALIAESNRKAVAEELDVILELIEAYDEMHPYNGELKRYTNQRLATLKEPRKEAE